MDLRKNLEVNKMSNENVKNEYRHNQKFREYVDRYSDQRGISVDEALKHELVKQVYLYYTDT